MRTLIVILIIASFIQFTILPFNLVLIILICRAYIKTEKENLFLAFAFGLVVSHLSLNIFGLQSLIYLILIQITQMLSKLRLAGHPLLIIPLSFIFLSLNTVTISLVTAQTTALFPQVMIESLLSLPIFYLMRVWEERFIVRSEIKLKV